MEFAWFEEDATNPAEQLTVSTGYLKLGVLTVNEVRADIGRDPVEGGDVPMIFTATGAVPLSVAIAPPPPPVAPQIGHNGGPPLDGEGRMASRRLPGHSRVTGFQPAQEAAAPLG